jgi:hypothetical protein
MEAAMNKKMSLKERFKKILENLTELMKDIGAQKLKPIPVPIRRNAR